MRAHLFEFLRKLHVVLERIFVALFVEEIAGVTNRAFANGVGVLHGLHRGLEVGQVIERIKDPENIHAVLGRMFHKRLYDVVRIIGVTHRVGAAEEHLETNVRHGLAQLAQALPRIFAQETHRRVKRRPAPHLQAEKIRRAARDGVGGVEHILRAHARGEQALVRVTQRGISDQQALLLACPRGEFLRALLQKNLPRACGRFLIAVVSRLGDRREGLFHLKPFRLRIAVHHHVANVTEQPVRAITARAEGEQLRRGIDQRRARLTIAEGLVLDDVFDERNVRLHAADAEFLQRAVHAIERNRKAHATGGNLHQQRIVERRDDTAGITLPSIEPHAETSRRTVSDDAPVIGREIVGRILRGHPRLHGVPHARHVLLLGQLHHFTVQFAALRHLNLRPHEVDTGHHFRDRVLHLNARVHLDEVPLLGIHVVQELHRTGVVVPNVLGQLHGRGAQLAAHRFIQRHTGGNFHHLLVAALHRAIALVQMQNVAVLVTQNLHFDVLGARHVFLEEHRRVAKGAIGLAAGFIEQPLQILGLVHHAHTAPATAEGRLDD